MTEKRAMTVAHSKTRQHRTSGRNDEKMVARHKQTSISSSWVPLQMSSSLTYSFFTAMRTVIAIAIRNAHAFPSELQCCQEEDAQVIGWCHDQDDVCQLAWLCPSSFFCIFCFLNSSALSLSFHFSGVVERHQRSLFWSSRTLTDW